LVVVAIANESVVVIASDDAFDIRQRIGPAIPIAGSPGGQAGKDTRGCVTIPRFIVFPGPAVQRIVARAANQLVATTTAD
jgi:hypothetical protein